MLNEKRCARQCIYQEFRSYQTPWNFQLIILTQFDVPRSFIMHSGLWKYSWTRFRSIYICIYIYTEAQSTSIVFAKQIPFCSSACKKKLDLYKNRRSDENGILYILIAWLIDRIDFLRKKRCGRSLILLGERNDRWQRNELGQIAAGSQRYSETQAARLLFFVYALLRQNILGRNNLGQVP